MTLRHVPDFFMDGYIAISYCKVCSAEGDKLFDICSGPVVSGLPYFKHLTKEEFDKLPVDNRNQNAK